MVSKATLRSVSAGSDRVPDHALAPVSHRLYDSRTAVYTGQVAALPTSIKARRDLEDRAAELGAKRAKLQARLESNTSAMTALVGRAEGSGIPYEQLAALLGVSRQTLFNWREAARARETSEAEG
jgi:hypothetical protein